MCNILHEINNYASKIYSLVSSSYTCELDLTEDEKPGYKFYKWEMKGVPVRLEVGKSEVEEGSVTVFRRDTIERTKVSEEELLPYLEDLFEDIEEKMREKARKYFESMVTYVEDVEKLRSSVQNKLTSFPWCGGKECALEVEEVAGYSMIGYEENSLKGKNKKCIVCGKEAPHLAWIGRSY
jgi:prolyl-tRNA synthetase